MTYAISSWALYLKYYRRYIKIAENHLRTYMKLLLLLLETCIYFALKPLNYKDHLADLSDFADRK